MPRDGAGNYTAPAGQPVVTGTTISSTVFNALVNDIVSTFTGSLAKDGQTTPTANLPMGGFKHTGVADGTSRTHYASVGQTQDSTLTLAGSVAGTDTITASLTPAITAYVTGMKFIFLPANANAGAATLGLNGLTAKTILKWTGEALAANDLLANVPALVVYDGTNFRLLNPQGLGNSAVKLANITQYQTTTGNIGYLNIPVNSQSGNYTCVLTDAGTAILHPSGGGAGDTYTIPANASVAYPVGTVLTFVNRDSNSVAITINTDTLTLAATTTTGSRTLLQNGVASAIKVESTLWLISGTGLS